jgi:hypothetical protein
VLDADAATADGRSFDLAWLMMAPLPRVRARRTTAPVGVA